MLRRIAGFAAVLVVAGVSFVVGDLYGALTQPVQPHVALTNDLPATWAEANRTFDTRIKSSFPIGSPLAQMKTLRSQGFVRGDWGDGDGDRHHAFRREDRFPCNILAQVFWRHDGSGKLTDVSGTYGEAGCL